MIELNVQPVLIKNDDGEYINVPAIGRQGPQGEPGPAGPPGSDADVTAENITAALGYTAADDADVEYLREKVNQIEMAKFPNVTIIGAPTLNQGQISGFSETSYCRFPFVVDFQGRPFEILFDITTGTNVAAQQNIMDSDFGLAFAVRSGHFVIAISTNGINWNLGEGVGTFSVQPSTSYRVRIAWDGATYTVAVSTDGAESWVTDITKAGSAAPYPRQIYIGVGEVSGVVANVFSGIINLNYASLTISNKLVWQGMDDVGIATRMAVDMSNIDVAGVTKVNELIADSPAVSQLNQSLTHKATNPENPVVGGWGRVASIGEDGQPVWETAALPKAGLNNAEGIVTFSSNAFVTYPNGGYQTVGLTTPSDNELQKRSGSRPVVLNVLDKSVKAAMSAPIADTGGLIDGVYHYPAWTAEEQAAAQTRIGIVTLTQEEYDLLETKGENTIYIIVEATT